MARRCTCWEAVEAAGLRIGSSRIVAVLAAGNSRRRSEQAVEQMNEGRTRSGDVEEVHLNERGFRTVAAHKDRRSRGHGEHQVGRAGDRARAALPRMTRHQPAEKATCLKFCLGSHADAERQVESDTDRPLLSWPYSAEPSVRAAPQHRSV